MAKQSKTVITKKRRGPAPTGRGHLIGVRLQPEDLKRLDEWRTNQIDRPGRPEAIRQLMTRGIFGDTERRIEALQGEQTKIARRPKEKGKP